MTLYQQKDVLSYTSSVVIENILPDSIVEKIPSLWKQSKLFPTDKYKLIFKAVRRDIVNNPDVGLSQRLCETKEGAMFYSMTRLLFLNLLKLPEKKVNENTVQQSLEECKLPKEYIQLIISNLLDSKIYSKLQDYATENYIRKNKVVNISWNLNIALCSNLVNKILEPTIVLNIQIENGKSIAFEMSLKQFHNLRYQISTLLKSVMDLEARQILKIIN